MVGYRKKNPYSFITAYLLGAGKTLLETNYPADFEDSDEFLALDNYKNARTIRSLSRVRRHIFDKYAHLRSTRDLRERVSPAIIQELDYLLSQGIDVEASFKFRYDLAAVQNEIKKHMDELVEPTLDYLELDYTDVLKELFYFPEMTKRAMETYISESRDVGNRFPYRLWVFRAKRAGVHASYMFHNDRNLIITSHTIAYLPYNLNGITIRDFSWDSFKDKLDFSLSQVAEGVEETVEEHVVTISEPETEELEDTQAEDSQEVLMAELDLGQQGTKKDIIYNPPKKGSKKSSKKMVGRKSIRYKKNVDKAKVVAHTKTLLDKEKVKEKQELLLIETPVTDSAFSGAEKEVVSPYSIQPIPDEMKPLLPHIEPQPSILPDNIFKKSDFVAPTQSSLGSVYYVDCDNVNIYSYFALVTEISESAEKGEKHTFKLYCDDKTNPIWSLTETLVKGKFDVIRIPVTRINEQKSVVDIVMASDISKDFHRGMTTSQFIVSSDSDFFGVIESGIDVGIYYETQSVATAYLRYLYQNNIKHTDISKLNTLSNSTKFKMLIVSHVGLLCITKMSMKDWTVSNLAKQILEMYNKSNMAYNDDISLEYAKIAATKLLSGLKVVSSPEGLCVLSEESGVELELESVV